MRTWLKRMVAGIVSAGTLMGGGLLMAGTANADEIRMPDIGKTITSLTASAATTYPRELVNGGFEYLPDGGWKTVDAPSYMTNAYTSVDPNNGQYMRNAQHSDADLASWVDWPGFDQSKFAWKTDQKGGHDQGGLKDRAEAVELQQDSMDGNTYTEMVASEPGRTIYQNLATIPGTLYKIRLKHTSLCKDNVDQMQVVINGTPIEMTRVAANGKAGDKVGEKSKTIGTRVTNENRWHHSDQWETYEGYYVIPDGQTTTRFGFKAVNYLDPTKGNLLDDVTFARAYKLSYDKNASDATGKVPSNQRGKENTVEPAKAKTTGTVKTVADENVRYGSLANGDFSYPSFSDIQKNEQETPADLRTFIKSDDGTLWYNMSNTDLSKYGKIGQIPGFDSSRFAWSSTENGSRVELQQDRNTKNTYAEIVAQQDNTSIYQNVSTGNGGVLYKIRLKHASRQSSHADRMQVLVGADTNHATPVEMTRVTSNGHGDKVGGKSTTITTKVSNTDPRDHGAQWETYEGYYQVPEGQKNTVFMFKSLEGFKEVETLPGNNVGNLVDDIEFSRSYKLTYDKNSDDATGSVPSDTTANTVKQAKAKSSGTVRLAADRTDGKVSDLVQRTTTHADGSVTVRTVDTTTDVVSGCQVYYPAGQKITLATMAKDDDCWDSSMLSRPGHTQLGWNQDRNATQAQAEVTMVEGGMAVYAVWVGNPVLTYDTNKPATWSGQMPSTPASVSVAYNTAAADKSGWAAGDTGKIPGYRFDGWYTAPNGGNKYDFNTPLTGNVTVYAHWVGNGYTVRFTGNGATGGNTPDQAFQYNIGQNLHRNGFTRDGYTFTGWRRADNQQAYGDGQWVNNLTTQPNGIVTMVAQWSANEAHIRYNPNPPAGKTTGGQGTPNWDGHTGDTPAIGGNGWTIDGYTFAGWTTSPDGSGARYAPGARWTANGTLTLYAQWTPGQASLTYDGNGATGGKTDEKINVRDNGFTRDGYTFVTWNTQADCKGNAVKPNSEWTLRGSSTLYACWAGNAQTLTYHGNGATGGNTAAQSGKTGDELTTNANGFTRDGYTFVRWDTARDGSGTAYGEGKNGVSQYVMKPAGNDLYAIWKANPATIQYRNDWPNTTGSTPDTTGNTGDTVTVSQNSFDRPGYTFTGWSTSKRGDPSLQPGDKHTLEPGTTTVWAQWKANPAHLVYNSNIGSIGSETKTVDGVVDQTVKTLGNPFDRPGYTFSGWNTQADGKGKAYDPGADYTLTANDKSTPKNTSVLYAQWTINKVTLKFDPNGGVGGYPSINTDAFGSVTIPKDAKEPKVTRPGFRFTGWSLKKTPDKDETLLTPGKDTVSMPAEGEVAVYAQWEPSMTTLPFTGGNAQIPTIWLWAGLAFLIIAAGAFSPMIRLRMGAGSKGRHAGTPTIGRHSR